MGAQSRINRIVNDAKWDEERLRTEFVNVILGIL